MRHALLLSSVLAACSSNGTAPPDAPINCAEVTGVDQFAVGLEHVGDSGKLNFRIISGDPAPPARDDNTWVVQVNAMNGVTVGPAVKDAVFTTIRPYMPAHMHTSGVQAKVMAMPTDGQYQLSRVNFFMPGVWETTIAVTSTAAGEDQAVFKFCIPP
jgi:YtkA-like protein